MKFFLFSASSFVSFVNLTVFIIDYGKVRLIAGLSLGDVFFVYYGFRKVVAVFILAKYK